MKKVIISILIGVLTLSLVACGNGSKSASASKNAPIIISGKKWTEQLILPYILADYIKAKTNYKVKVDDGGLGPTPMLTQALKNGKIDMYVDYTGTGWLTVLKEKYDPSLSANEIYNKVKQGYKKKMNLVWLKPLGFENTYALALRQDTYNKLNQPKTDSALAKYSSQIKFGGPPTFFEREDGYDNFTKTYGYKFKNHVSLDANIMYSALKNGKVDAIPAFTTDGRIARFHFKVLKDDKHFFPPYYAAPIIRQQTLDSHPKLKEVINQLAGKISEKEMSEMNAQVDIDKKDPKDVAKAFLKKKGLIK